MTTTTSHHYHDRILHDRLKKLILATILIPVLILVAFTFFGPTVGTVFSLFSKNRGQTQDADTIAPTTPLFKSAPKAVNSTKITLEGFAEGGSTVKLFVNGPETASTVATSDGTFSFSDIELIKGRNTVFVRTTDQNGNESAPSQTLTIQYDDDKPKIEIESPKDKEIVKNLNNRIVITGKTNEKATIKINDNLAVQKPDFTFEFVLGVKEGEVKIKVEATDDAGNAETKEITVTYLYQS